MARLTIPVLAQLVLVICVLTAQAEKVMRPKFKDIKLWSDTKILTHTFTYDANDPHLNLTWNVLQDMANIDLTTEIRVTQKLDPTYFFAMNSTINVCNLFKWRSESPIGMLLHGYLKEYGHLMESCPIVKGEYFIHKFWYPEDPSMAMLPEADFALHFAAHSLDANKKRTLILEDHITGEAVVHDVTNVKRGIFAMLPKVG